MSPALESKQSENPNHQHWVAQLDLGFEQRATRTVMAHRKHFGPVRVQKMLWPEKTGVCHAIIVHPPAGMAGGDHVSFTISVEKNAHALLTTPGAGKWYRSNGQAAVQQISLKVAQDAVLEWLPQESMLFDGANAQSQSCIRLHDKASFIGWEMLVIGRQARQEYFATGHYSSQLQLWLGDQLLLAERLNFAGQDRFLSSTLGMNGKAVMGSFWALAPQAQRDQQMLDQQLECIRELLMRIDAPVRITRLDAVLSARYLGDDVRQCHDAFAAIRARLRRDWFALDEEFPRIWRT
jgi:urease accessory protein